MRSLNTLHGNGADKLLEKYVLLSRDIFQRDLLAAFMGIAFGGDVEMCARHWKGCGEVYGYDTFEGGHPRNLSPDLNSFEATCMDYSYNKWGTEELSFDWQINELKKQGLTNAHLVKGLVRSDSCDQLPHLNLAWLDMDLNVSMLTGFYAVDRKLVPGGFLVMHDVVPQGHIENNYEIFYDGLFDDSKWEEVKIPLHILTTCFRTENLRLIAEYLAPAYCLFDLRWHIVFDGSRVSSETVCELPDILELPFVEVHRRSEWPRGNSADFKPGWGPCVATANDLIDKITSGWIWINDDDTVAHPDLFPTLNQLIRSHPTIEGWIFGMAGHGWTRGCHYDSVKVGDMDIGQYVLHRSLIKNTRFDYCYGFDGLFIEEIFKRNPSAIGFHPVTCTYHNWLRS